MSMNTVSMNSLRFYHEYLKILARIEGRPYRLPKDLDNLKRKTPGIYKILNIITYRLKENDIREKRTYIKFLKVAEVILKRDFNLQNILASFDILIKKFDSFDNIYREEGRLIKKSFTFIEEFCMMNKIKNKNDLFVGNPPLIVKWWKQKKIDDYTFAELFDVRTVISKRWAKIYLGRYNYSSSEKFREEIVENIFLHTTMQKSVAKLNNFFKE
jgi:hypothetical protein